MEFITIVHPTKKGSAESKRQAHSHAARVAHARARRLRTAEYLKSKNTIETEKISRIEPTSQKLQTTAPAHLPGQIVSRKRDVQGVSLSIPIVLSTAFEHEPLASFLRSLTSRERFIFNHYVQVFAPGMQAECPVLTSLGEYHGAMKRNWVLMSSTDIDLLQSFLLAACRDLSIMRSQQEYAELAIQYKLRHVKDLRKALKAGDLLSSRTAVTRALILAFDDIMLHDDPMAAKHVMGAVQIIKAYGGIQALGLSDIVRAILYSCIHGKSLFKDPDSIWAEGQAQLNGRVGISV